MRTTYFPATTQLEHLDLFWSWGHAYLTLNQPAIAPVGEALPNTEIFRRLAHRMGFSDACFLETDEDMVRAALTSTHPYAKGITFERLKQDGWARLRVPEDFRPFADGGFATPSGKCEFYSEGLAITRARSIALLHPCQRRSARHGCSEEPLSPLAHHRQVCAAFPQLQLRQSSQTPRGGGRAAARLASARCSRSSISNGDLVRAHNARGELRIRARVGERRCPRDDRGAVRLVGEPQPKRLLGQRADCRRAERHGRRRRLPRYPGGSGERSRRRRGRYTFTSSPHHLCPHSLIHSSYLFASSRYHPASPS